MEIEKKYLVSRLPEQLERYPAARISQCYISRDPVIRLRASKQLGYEGENERIPEEETVYVLTVKGRGLTVRTEYELPLLKEQYENLLPKAEEGSVEKVRHRVGLKNDLTAELDIFEGRLAGLMLVEVEFESIKEMQEFVPPSWFGADVSSDERYHNSNLSRPGSEASLELSK